MNITSGKQKRAVGDAGERYSRITKIKETPRCLCPSGIAVYSIPTSKIKPPYPPNRRAYSPESIAALAQSIHKYGVIHPLTVKDMPNGNYELVCGERRLRAVRLLGLSSVNCIVISTDRQKTDALMLCDNIQAEEMHFLDIAEAMGRLCSKYSLDVSSVAARLCIAETFAAEKLRLLDYSESERQKIRESKLTERQATSIISIDDEEARKNVLCEVCTRHMDEQATDSLVLSYLKKRLKKTAPKTSACLVRDIRIFYNTIERALDVMRSSGYSIGAEKHENELETSIKITIPKELIYK